MFNNYTFNGAGGKVLNNDKIILTSSFIYTCEHVIY